MKKTYEFERQLLMSTKRKFKAHNIGKNRSYPDMLSIKIPNGTNKRLSIKDWIEHHPSELYEYLTGQKKVFIAKAIFRKLEAILGIK